MDNFQLDRSRNGDAIAGNDTAARRDAEISSAALRDRILWLFECWEHRHGFRQGAGIRLVPAGYVP